MFGVTNNGLIKEILSKFVAFLPHELNSNLPEIESEDKTT